LSSPSSYGQGQFSAGSSINRPIAESAPGGMKFINGLPASGSSKSHSASAASGDSGAGEAQVSVFFVIARTPRCTKEHAETKGALGLSAGRPIRVRWESTYGLCSWQCHHLATPSASRCA
jgi:hypothetical protein